MISRDIACITDFILSGAYKLRNKHIPRINVCMRHTSVNENVINVTAKKISAIETTTICGSSHKIETVFGEVN